MTFKKILTFIVAIPFLAACNHIDENEVYIPVDKQPLQQKVLLEEFTGQNCTNCPKAHAEIEKLQKQYGDNLIVVSIHSGSFGIPVSRGGLMQEEGDIYANQFGVDKFPLGVVGRTSGNISYGDFAAAVRYAGSTPASMSLDIEAELSSDGKTINISGGMMAENYVSGNLQLWVVEDGIIAFQIDGRDRLPEYVHNNVYRATVNGINGEPVSLETNNYHSFSHSIEVRKNETYVLDSWNTDNLYIVGFVYNDSGIVVAQKTKVI